MLLALLLYGYATGTYSSRKIERATIDSIAFCYIAANTTPDHDTIADFRRRVLAELPKVFLAVLSLAKELGFLKVGQVSLDGTKIKANASKHHALSHGHIGKSQAHLRREIKRLMKLAEQAECVRLPFQTTGIPSIRMTTGKARRLATTIDKALSPTTTTLIDHPHSRPR